MTGSKSMLATNKLTNAKGGAQIARKKTVRAQMVNSASKGPPGQVVNSATQNVAKDRTKDKLGL